MAEPPSDGRGAPGGAAPPDREQDDQPKERSTRGRIIVRSSSHPPRGARAAEPLDARETSGARALPASDPPEREQDVRSKRTTPSERPRKRREVQTRSLDRARMDTPTARPSSKRRRGSDPTGVAVGRGSEPGALENGARAESSTGSAAPLRGAAQLASTPSAAPAVRSTRLVWALGVGLIALLLWTLLRG
jgi:hypothetical protein